MHKDKKVPLTNLQNVPIRQYYRPYRRYRRTYRNPVHKQPTVKQQIEQVLHQQKLKLEQDKIDQSNKDNVVKRLEFIKKLRDELVQAEDMPDVDQHLQVLKKAYNDQIIQSTNEIVQQDILGVPMKEIQIQKVNKMEEQLQTLAKLQELSKEQSEELQKIQLAQDQLQSSHNRLKKKISKNEENKLEQKSKKNVKEQFFKFKSKQQRKEQDPYLQYLTKQTMQIPQNQRNFSIGDQKQFEEFFSKQHQQFEEDQQQKFMTKQNYKPEQRQQIQQILQEVEEDDNSQFYGPDDELFINLYKDKAQGKSVNEGMFVTTLYQLCNDSFQDYKVQIITNNDQRIMPETEKLIVIFFYKHHFMVLLNMDGEKLYYFDPLALPEYYDNFKNTIQNYALKISPEENIKIKKNVTPWQTTDPYCGYYVYLFLHNMIIQDEGYQASIQKDNEDRQMLKEMLKEEII